VRLVRFQQKKTKKQKKVEGGRKSTYQIDEDPPANGQYFFRAVREANNRDLRGRLLVL
jgi:hypothetical protein